MNVKKKDTKKRNYILPAVITLLVIAFALYFTTINATHFFALHNACLSDRFVKEYYHSFRLFGEILENLEIQQDEMDFKAQTLVFDYIEAKKEIELDRIKNEMLEG